MHKDWLTVKHWRFEYDDDDNLEYIGGSYKIDPADTDMFLLLKITYSGGNITQAEEREGRWSDRETIFDAA